MFVDYYEVLEVSPNANPDTIDQVFRYFAKRYHPDNRSTGDMQRFNEIVEAHTTLKDSVKRAQYDLQHKNHLRFRRKLADDEGDSTVVERDSDVQDKLLSFFYVKRRQNIANPGIGNFDLERLMDCPPEHLEFHIWYLREKGWIARLENGMLAITVAGVDHANSGDHREAANLLTDQNLAARGLHV